MTSLKRSGLDIGRSLECDAGIGTATRSYLLCAVPRTGSYLLCDLLGASGVAGRPNEYFNPGFQAQWQIDWGSTTIEQYLRAVTHRGTTPNGVFGLKAHPMQFDALCRQLAGRNSVKFVDRPGLLAAWLPEVEYIRLCRRDRLRQAISYVRAIQTHGWWDSAVAPGPSAPARPELERFDVQLIDRAMTLLGSMHDRWSRYFAAIGVTPLEITYEDLTGDPAAAVGAVLDHLDVPRPVDPTTAHAPFRRQADDVTEEWVHRYLRIRDGLPGAPSPRLSVAPRTRPVRHLREWPWRS